MLTCKNLHLEYKDGDKSTLVLNGINLEIKKGEKVIFLGPSGSGKSSLIYLLSTLRRPTKGEVYLDDTLISSNDAKIDPNIRKTRFGFIFQMHFLIPYLTVLENVLSTLNSKDKQSCEKAIAILKKIKMEDHINKKTHQLSGGERQRVAIARALMNDPDIIFADEPTASLDHKTAREVLSVLKKYKKDAILIMATHDTSILQGDERVLKVANGNISEN